MKAVVIERYGGNDVVQVRDMPRPVPGREEALVKVHGASVNPVDWKIRSGKMKILTGKAFPKVLGCECAGEVLETGVAVTRYHQGDRVIGFPGIKRLAGFAEYVCIHEHRLYPIPDNITFEQAATLPIAGLTALQALRDQGRIAGGHQVLINGASGGVGTFAVQIATIFGAKVTAVCSAANADLVQGLGADRMIDYTVEDFTKGGALYDVVFDAVSKRSFAECKKVLASEGIYIATIPTPSVLLNQYLTGLLISRQARAVMVKPNARDMDWMRAHIEAGKIRIIIDRIFPLEDIREAFAYSEAGHARGKVVLNIPQAAV